MTLILYSPLYSDIAKSFIGACEELNRTIEALENERVYILSFLLISKYHYNSFLSFVELFISFCFDFILTINRSQMTT